LAKAIQSLRKSEERYCAEWRKCISLLEYRDEKGLT
jgi:hypothetical protein